MQKSHRLNRLMSRRRAVAGAAATTAAVGIGTVPAMCQGHVYPGIKFRSLDLGGMTQNQVDQELRITLADFESRALTLTYDDQAWDASLNEIGYEINYAAMVEIAMAHGRGNGFLHRYETFVDRDTSSRVPLKLIGNKEELTSFLSDIAGEVDIAPTDARLTFAEGEISVEPHVTGQSVDIETLTSTAIASLQDGLPATVPVTANPTQAHVKSEDLAGAREDAWKLVSEPIIFNHSDLSYPIGTDQLTRALQINSDNSASLDPTMLRHRFEEIAQATRTAPKNVKLGWDGAPFVVTADEAGAEADLTRMEDVAIELAQSDKRIAALPMNVIEAPARADNIDELGIESRLATGSSSFVGSSVARAENVLVSANNISYKLVAPGEIFSFNDLLGPITEDYGYVSGTIIQDNWVESDIGGGVCQVSTTVFRSAARAGFRFDEWNPHSWRLAFYEADGSDPGFDAAIYQAESENGWSLDLKFENVLGSWLLLAMVIDGETVSANFYGKDPGWDIEIFPARVSDPIEPGSPEERVNEDLAPGERKQVQTAQPGYQVSVRRLITGADGSVIADGDFVSNYVPQPEAWEVGPG